MKLGILDHLRSICAHRFRKCLLELALHHEGSILSNLYAQFAGSPIVYKPYPRSLLAPSLQYSDGTRSSLILEKHLRPIAS